MSVTKSLWIVNHFRNPSLLYKMCHIFIHLVPEVKHFSSILWILVNTFLKIKCQGSFFVSEKLFLIVCNMGNLHKIFQSDHPCVNIFLSGCWFTIMKTETKYCLKAKLSIIYSQQSVSNSEPIKHITKLPLDVYYT